MGLFGKSKFEKAFAPYEMEGEKPRPFWMGGDKFTGRDAIAGILAAIGDVAAQQSGGEPMAVQNLTGGRLSAIEQARKLQAEQQQIMAARQRAQAAGLSGPQADLMAYGDAKYSDLAQKPPELPTEARLAQWYQNATPEQKAAFDQIRPIITNGYGSAVVPRGSLPGAGGLPPGYDPNEWEPVAGPGGGGGNATGGFPPRYRR